MRKLILTIALVLTVGFANAQEEFSEFYNYYTTDVDSEWFGGQALITYNVGNNNLHYRVYTTEYQIDLVRVSDFHTGYTDNGTKFLAFETVSVDTKESCIIQYFYKREYGVRLIFSGGYIQLAKY